MASVIVVEARGIWEGFFERVRDLAGVGLWERRELHFRLRLQERHIVVLVVAMAFEGGLS